MARLGEKQPALREQADELQGESRFKGSERAAAPADQPARHREDENEKRSTRGGDHQRRPAVEEIARVE